MASSTHHPLFEKQESCERPLDRTHTFSNEPRLSLAYTDPAFHQPNPRAARIPDDRVEAKTPASDQPRKGRSRFYVSIHLQSGRDTTNNLRRAQQQLLVRLLLMRKHRTAQVAMAKGGSLRTRSFSVFIQRCRTGVPARNSGCHTFQVNSAFSLRVARKRRL